MSKIPDQSAGQRASDEPATDLLGDEMRPYRDPRGRPKMRRINELRDRVAILAAGGMLQDQIAAAIGCSTPTLTKYFFKELTAGKAAKTAAMLAKLYEFGMAGSVPAVKAFLQIAQKSEALPPPPKKEKLGKKEARFIASQTAHQGSEWSDLLH